MGDAEWDSGPRQGGVTLRVSLGLGPERGRTAAAGAQRQAADVSTCQLTPSAWHPGWGCDGDTEKVSHGSTGTKANSWFQYPKTQRRLSYFLSLKEYFIFS